ncbi:hypothetical protein VE00_11063 [Pseudogymnoascus sp. WSF 3629]|nr:hypothetical protein VE00_11063 [Pseudogymnoascus sp. WSF 3629]
MRGLSLVGLLALTCFTSAANLLPRNYEASDYYVLHLDSDAAPADIAKRLGLSHEGQLGELEDHHIFSAARHEDDRVQDAIKARRKLRKRGASEADVLDAVKLALKQKLKPRMEKRGVMPVIKDRPSGIFPERQIEVEDPVGVARQAEVKKILGIHDPIFNNQWHLYNNKQLGHDVNVTDVWIQGITGHNATVAIVDDGLDMYSEDLMENYFAEGSYDFNDPGPEPKPKLSDDRHGTRCAGEVGAAKNNVCGVGVAYNSKIAGIRILSKLITDADEAIALNYAYQQNQIYSCSWGPPDDGKSMDAPGILIKRAMLNAVQRGRGGLGSVYVFASGNGAASEDNCNFDGYTNSIYSITVGAVDRRGDHPYYSEKCSAQLVVTYSSGGGDQIVTTDVGANNCATTHGGTSAAAPLAAGIFALVLSVRPDLTWRDMQSLAMQTAVTIDSADDWQTTTIGKKFSHTFGYGKIDSWAIVEAAKTFKSLKPQAWLYSPWIKVNKPIPQGNQGLAVTYEVTADMLKEANLERLEHVTVTMNVEHQRRGDLSLDLISPDSLVSHLSATRKNDDSPNGYADWTFMSVVHWGESGIGTWKLILRDTTVNDFSGNFTDFHIKLWGEAIDPSKATLLPLPNANDDDDHDFHKPSSTISATVSTTSLNPVPTSTAPPLTTDQPNRPVPPKPTSTLSASSTPTAPSDDLAASSTAAPSSWLPGWLPSFGFGPKTTIWIYAATVLIVGFCIGLAIYFYLARRKRLRNSARDNYEFDLIRDDEETEGLTGGRPKRRAGELYDAFAAGSDEEGLSDVEEEGEEYRDVALRGMEAEHHVIGGDSESESEDEGRGEKAALRGE